MLEILVLQMLHRSMKSFSNENTVYNDPSYTRIYESR